MKTGKIIGYAALGIIAGLLLENKSLHLRQLAGQKMRKFRKKAGNKVSDAVGTLTSATS